MILTCPACETKYVVKDGAIPIGGRQVRCASCKTAWHQDPDPVVDDDSDVTTSPVGEENPPSATDTLGGPPVPADHVDAGEASHLGELPAQAAAETMVSDYAEPSVEPDSPSPIEPAERDPAPVGMASFAPLSRSLPAGASYGLTAPIVPAPNTEAAAKPEPAHVPFAEPISDAADHGIEHDGWTEGDPHFISSIDGYDEPNRRGIKIALILVVLVGLAAAALWFVAPNSLKERIGLADASSTPLEVMLTASDRQKLASGNELLAISGRVINPTDAEQAVPPIRASLRNRTTRKMVYQWTIAPPARSLPPRGSASFNSAEVDIPSGGDELTVTLGGAAR